MEAVVFSWKWGLVCFPPTGSRSKRRQGIGDNLHGFRLGGVDVCAGYQSVITQNTQSICFGIPLAGFVFLTRFGSDKKIKITSEKCFHAD